MRTQQRLASLLLLSFLVLAVASTPVAQQNLHASTTCLTQNVCGVGSVAELSVVGSTTPYVWYDGTDGHFEVETGDVKIGRVGAQTLNITNPSVNVIGLNTSASFIRFYKSFDMNTGLSISDAGSGYYLSTTGLNLGGGVIMGFSSGNATNPSDAGFERLEAGIVKMCGDAACSVGATLKLGDYGSKPACGSTYRGVVWHEFGGAGVADTVEVCTKDSSDVYAWVAAATIS